MSRELYHVVEGVGTVIATHDEATDQEAMPNVDNLLH